MKPQKRSVSPFGLVPAEEDPFEAIRNAFKDSFPSSQEKTPKELKNVEDARFIPVLIEEITAAPANDAPKLDTLCRFLLRFRGILEEKGLAAPVEVAMHQLFERKTELFMIDHQDREHCEKLGLADPYRDLVLFSKERDALVGRYFAPLNDATPGRFSEFITLWMESPSPDRILHFIDFCAGSKNPTFEYYLLFTHPALHRIVTNKNLMRDLFDKSKPVLAKLTSPSWEKDVRLALGVS